ncbi:MAG TPA: HEAT repeat domain-containing protein [Gemmataceae bacterium]|nr:HEAT repeat domain-containing protein [Gemmataceae bacterium]
MTRLLPALFFAVCFTTSLRADEDVPSLIADLTKTDADKVRAAEKLEALGPRAADATSALIGLFSTKNEDVRLHAALALGKIGKAAAQPLSVALGNEDADVRFYAAWSLAFNGPDAKASAPALLKALGDTSGAVRRKAAYALGRIDPDPDMAVTALIALLTDANADVRGAAQSALAAQGSAAVPKLIGLLSGKVEMRDPAIAALAEIGPGAKDAIPPLKALLLNPSPASAPAGLALAKIGGAAIPALVAATESDNRSVRDIGIHRLEDIGVPAVPALVDLLGAKNVDMRRYAAQFLASYPVNDKMVIIGLGYATKDADTEVRRTALSGLQTRGQGAKLAEPYVSALLTDLDPQMRLQAFHVLQNLGVNPQPGLKKALASTDPAIRINTASLMMTLNLEPALAEPVLLDALKTGNTALKTQAAYTLAKRGMGADVVVPIFLEGLKDKAAGIRRQSAEALASYGARAREALPLLNALLEDADDSVRSQAFATLSVLGVGEKELFAASCKILRTRNDKLNAAAAATFRKLGPTMLPEVLATLRGDDAKTDDGAGLRLVCLQTLTMSGPGAKEALADLTKALRDPSPKVRLTAARALGNLGPDAKNAVDALAALKNDSEASVKAIAKAALAQIAAVPGADFEVQGVLTADDPFDSVRQNCHQVIHGFPMKAGRSYTIDLISTGVFDNFLRLEDAAGTRLAADDDSGGNLNARIANFQPPRDGWYRIIVTTFAPNTAGAYTLKVR